MKYNQGFAPIAVLLLVLLIAGAGAVVYVKTKEPTIQPVTTATEATSVATTQTETTVTTPVSTPEKKPVQSVKVTTTTTVSFKNDPTLTDYQKQEIQKQIDEAVSGTQELKTSFQDLKTSYGLPTTSADTGTITEAEIKEITDTAVAAELKGSDAAVKSMMQTGVPSNAEIYYNNENNYGINASKNVCTDPYLQQTRTFVENKYTKDKLNCIIGTVFPAKSYTAVIASVTQKGFYYCTDAKNYGVLIQLSGGTYKPGETCK